MNLSGNKLCPPGLPLEIQTYDVSPVQLLRQKGIRELAPPPESNLQMPTKDLAIMHLHEENCNNTLPHQSAVGILEVNLKS